MVQPLCARHRQTQELPQTLNQMHGGECKLEGTTAEIQNRAFFVAFSHLPSPAASMHSSSAASISNSNNSSATRNRSRSSLPQSFCHYCYCFQNSTLDTSRSRQTTTTAWRLHKGFSDNGFSGVPIHSHDNMVTIAIDLGYNYGL